MAGAGVRLFTPGQILTADQVNQYLQDQVVCRFADVAARDAAFGGVGEPTLSEGRICYLDSDNTVYIYTGSAWVELQSGIAGTAGQVVVYDSSGDPIAQTLTGDVTISSSAVTSIAAGAIVNADVSTSAAIAYSKLSLANSITTTDLASGAPRAGFRSTQNAQTGTSYTLALTDLGALVELNNTSAITLTIPSEATVAFAVGDRIDIVQTGTGQVTVVGATSPNAVTVNAYDGGLKLNGQWAAATLVKRATNTWLAIGNLTT